MYDNPTIDEFKTYFVRGFVYSSDPTLGVTDQDIANAYGFTNVGINAALWETQTDYTLGYLQLSAHYLVINLWAGSQGLSGQWSWLEQAKSVGNVSQSFSIPQRILDNPEFSFLTKTNYGLNYLMMILPQLSGQMYTVCGTTRP